MTRLSVNINKIALIRNSRGGNNPDLLKCATDIEGFGAQGITVHPRPDERHIRRSDVRTLSKILKTEFNIEGYPSPEFIKLCVEVKPQQATLVPDAPNQLTSDHGWNVRENHDFLKQVVGQLKDAGIRASVFVDPDAGQIEQASLIGADRVELYTAAYAKNYPQSPEKAIEPYLEAANVARSLGLGLNAGHDLSLENLRYWHQRIDWTAEVSIGHALICDALYLGLKETVGRYLDCLK